MRFAASSSGTVLVVLLSFMGMERAAPPLGRYRGSPASAISPRNLQITTSSSFE
jgi:hypothetical protein